MDSDDQKSMMSMGGGRMLSNPPCEDVCRAEIEPRYRPAGITDVHEKALIHLLYRKFAYDEGMEKTNRIC